MTFSPVFRPFRPEDLPEILRIQADNLVSNLPEDRRSDGFLLTAFSPRQFEEMDREIPIIVADRGAGLAGYLCSTGVAYSRSIPLLSRMIDLFPEITFRGRSLDRCRTFFYGPVCVDRPDRGRGVIEGLFRALMGRVRGRFDVGVLFVSSRNPRSMQAHLRKLGMTRVRDFTFDGRGFGFLVFEVAGVEDITPPLMSSADPNRLKRLHP